MAVLGGIGVVAFHQPIRSVLSLVLVMLALSVLFLLLSAQFVFAVQIIVYAGAVMVLFLFVIALLGPARELGRGRLRFQTWLSALFVLVLLGLMWALLQGIQYRQPEKADPSWFVTVSAILFTLGTVGVLIRRNPLVILISIELMLNAANLALVTFSRQLQNIDGQLFALMSMTVAAAEAVVGLAILVDIFRTRDAEDVDDLSELRG